MSSYDKSIYDYIIIYAGLVHIRHVYIYIYIHLYIVHACILYKLCIIYIYTHTYTRNLYVVTYVPDTDTH